MNRFYKIGQRGFTFTELVITVIILGVLSYVAFVKLSGENLAVKTEAAARKMVSDLHYAQELAMTTGKQTRVFVDLDHNRYFLKWADGTYIKNPISGRDFIINFDSGSFSGVKITSTDFSSGRLDFDMHGVPYNCGQLLSSEKAIAVFSEKISVVLTPYTGKIKMFR